MHCTLSNIHFQHRVHSMIQYNSNAVLKTIQIPDKEKINDELKHKNPLLIIYPDNIRLYYKSNE